VEELTVSTPEDYVKLTTRKFKVTSGAVFHINAMNASSMVYWLSIWPDDGFVDRTDFVNFVKENLVVVSEHIIQPNIIAPKIKPEQIFFSDVIDLLTELMDLSGVMGEEMTDESFPDEEGSPDA